MFRIPIFPVSSYEIKKLPHLSWITYLARFHNIATTSASTCSKYWHTIRYLKPDQIYRRLLLWVSNSRPDLEPSPCFRDSLGQWVDPPHKQTSLLSPEKVRLLNRERTIVFPVDWNATDESRLWLYNLHYFDYLNSIGSKERELWHRKLVDRWIVENLPGLGVGWEPYPVSLRIVNWIKWILAGAEINENMIHSLAIQTR